MASLSIIILTCNRLGRLLRGLERLLPQLEGGDEVVLIDTGSTDGTPNYFRTWSHPALRYITWQGHGSWAEMRNFGVAQARGELVAFLDDDCLPAEDWVARGRAALAGADAVGGLVQPHGIESWPEWWHPEMGWMVGLSVPGQMGPEAGRYHYPFTANLFARAEACRQLPFQEIGGRLGADERARYLTGREDAQWWQNLRVNGYATKFDPLLMVSHAIDPMRLDLRYLSRRAALDGQAWAARQGRREDIAPLATQWYRQLAAQVAAIWEQPETRRAHWHYHRLTRQRHGHALAALAERHLTGGASLPWLALQPALAAAATRHDFAIFKAMARELAGPWLGSRPVKPQALRVERIAVIALGYLGDLVILQSVLRGLMRSNPRLGLYVLAPASARTALGGVHRLNLTVLPELDPDSPEARAWMQRWLEQVNPDAITAPWLHEPWGRTVTGLRRPPRPIIGFGNDHGLRRQWRIKRLGVRVHKNLALHESENLCRLFEVAGLKCRPEPARLAPEPATVGRVRQHGWLAEGLEGPPLVMFNTDAGTPYKYWTAEGWQRLAAMIMEQTDWRIVVNAIGEQNPLDALADACPDRIHLLRQAPLSELIAWMAHCRAITTVDAGPQHLAHALDVPSLTLYGPMDERRWRDRWGRPIHRTLRACMMDLTPEEKRGLAANHEVALIEAERVWAELNLLVEEAPRLLVAGAAVG